ncbi:MULTISPECIES: hypothetical protein [unclassified Oleiphilus]|uniref:hypothetical protein n=1 Tax=unclassified Oleiphilus TaxID=2631174 RepID=UPI0012E926D7|nr:MULTISPECIES: hypothetical protein [unclassified Oleiphilus]
MAKLNDGDALVIHIVRSLEACLSHSAHCAHGMKRETPKGTFVFTQFAKQMIG